MNQLQPLLGSVLMLSFAVPLWAVALSAATGQQPRSSASSLQVIEVNGTKLHYVVRGSGQPVLFVHGSLGTYRTFQRQFEALSSSFLVVAFSRRFHPPNDIPANAERYAMQVHVDVAIAFALQHRELVRSLVLGEPPIVGLLQNSSVGRTLREAFERRTLTPARARVPERQSRKRRAALRRWRSRRRRF